MIPRTVVVAHRQMMVAEGITAALAGFPGIVPVGTTTVAPDAELLGSRADALAIDPWMPGARAIARRLRRGGVRVVFLGHPHGEDEDVRVSTDAPVAALAAALAPESRLAPPGSDVLTPRERDVLRLVSKGLPGKSVARELGISPKTVERHKTRIFSKLGVANQAAAAFAYANGSKGTTRGTD